MKTDQKFTPKYWVCHDVNGDDVYTFTLSKNRDDSVTSFIRFFGYHPQDAGANDSGKDVKCELVEVKLVEGI